VVVPALEQHDEFTGIEDVVNYLLRNADLRKLIEKQRVGGGAAGKAVFLFFDEDSERLADEAGLDVMLPSAELRHRLDSKIVTTRLGAEAGVPSVPNVLGRARTYEELKALAASAGLGEDLVVQTPYGDSGKTTYFVRSEGDWSANAEEMADEELKVMRRIEPKQVAIEACITRCGTVVGPLMTEITGHPELTPYRGGWAGNEIFPGALSARNRGLAVKYTHALGERLAKEGYRGYLEIDYLLDTETDEIYLGELNPRLSGISSITNVSAGAYADMPLFLFHLAEYLDLDFEIDVDEINKRWASDHLTDVWAQIIIKEPHDQVEHVTGAPRTGIYRLDGDGQIHLRRPALDWHNLGDEDEGFYLRILAPGDYRYKGADLGILVARTRLRDDDSQLTDRCLRWIDAIHGQFTGTPLGANQPAPPLESFAFKAG
jgi:biotin carboxylase